MTGWHSPPAELYALVEHTPATILLESAGSGALGSRRDSGRHSQCAPHTRLFTAPLRTLVANRPAELAKLFAEIESAVEAGLFAVGYFTYECGAFFEPTAAPKSSRPTLPLGQPLAWFGIYDRVYLFDHRAGAFLDGDPPGLDSFRVVPPNDETGPEPPIETAIALTSQEYAQRIAAIHDWIRSGDVYQLNFTFPLQIHAPGGSAALYQHLRARQPAPYCAFLHTHPNRRVLSFSPELFFRLDNNGEARRIATRPMKGTAARGRTTREDNAQAEWLRNDPKNRAENVMIVDLLRNDLGRLCQYGTVRAESLFAVERYPTLLQMTSTITGDLRPDADFQQIFRAIFPCGSITGAPKVRAMQLLAQIEDQPRGVYTGAIGFFSKNQSVFSVAIRTLELDGELGKMGVGSGIVVDSNPASEFRECLLKAEFLTLSLHCPPELFSLVETLLWCSGYPLIDLHLDRLEDSARYFAFPFDRAQIKAALVAHAASFAQTMGALNSDSGTCESTNLQASQLPRKVRLLLDQDGTIHITNESLIDTPAPARVRIASPRTNPNDPMFFHKTTHRPIYAEALKAATQAGFDDVLFLNLRGELTEGAIHNVFIEKDARLFTPPIECGLLPGVYRRHILETRFDAEEEVLHISDLHQADAIYLSNAVRGLRRAIIDWES